MAVINILIVDDHHLMIEGYKSMLAYNKSGFDIEVTAAFNCETAFNLLRNKNVKAFDFVFLDINLPPYKEENIATGEDLAILITKFLPDSKIVIMTSHTEGFMLYNIKQRLNPAGILVKSDFTVHDFLSAFEMMLSGESYYSSTVKNCIREINSKEIYLDNYNRQIISLLSKGIKTKNLPNYLPLSISAIDKRKAMIKDYFLIENGNDEDIISAARTVGLI